MIYIYIYVKKKKIRKKNLLKIIFSFTWKQIEHKNADCREQVNVDWQISGGRKLCKFGGVHTTNLSPFVAKFAILYKYIDVSLCNVYSFHQIFSSLKSQ